MEKGRPDDVMMMITWYEGQEWLKETELPGGLFVTLTVSRFGRKPLPKD